MKTFQLSLMLTAVFLALLWAGEAGEIEAADLFALTDTGEMFSSSDQGATWSVRSAIPVPDAAGLIAGSSSQELFLASRTGTVFRSTDAGMTWDAVGSAPASDVVALAARSDGALLVLTESGILWLSTDAGASFVALSALTASNCADLVPGAGQQLFALTETGGVASSSDGGIGWSVVGTMPVSDAVAIRAIDTSLYVLTDTGLTWRSTDAGATWQAVGTVSQVGMSGLASIGNELAAASREGLVARSSDGSAWSWVGAVNQLNVVALADDTPQIIGVPEAPVPRPRLAVAPPAPNPYRAGDVVQFRFTLPADDTVDLELFDLGGRLVDRRAPERFSAGTEQVIRWRPAVEVSGVYFVRLSTASGPQTATRIVALR